MSFKYNPALDGLRAIAVLLVMAFHARTPVALGGFIGVDVFFVLSGYLITTLLLTEIEVTGRIAINPFYLRRFWRLMPALIGLLVVYLFVAPLAWPDTDNHGLQVLLAALYLSDYAVAFWNAPEQLSHTWSLAIEEHFYLLWPALLLPLARRLGPNRLLAVLATGYVVAFGWRIGWMTAGQGWDAVYYRFDTHFTGILLGACLAVAVRGPLADARWSRYASRVALIPVLSLSVLLHGRWGEPSMLSWGLLIAEFATAAILLALAYPQGILHRLLATPVPVHLGRWSYAMYLWHYPIFIWLRERHDWHDTLLIGGTATIALAALSYYTIERLGRRAKRRVDG